MKTARAVAFVAALSAAACGAPLMKLPPGPGAPAADAAAAFTQATATCRRVATISAEVAVSGSVNGQRLRGRILAGLAAPAVAYLEAPAPFGAPIFVFAANDGEATLLLPRDRRVLERGVPGQVLEAVAGVPLDPPELRAALTGCAAADAAAFAQGVSLGSDWRKLPGDQQELYLRRERTSAPWRLVAAIHEGDTGWRADYRDFVGDLPRTIRLTSLAPRAFDLRLELSQVEINVPLDAATLRVRVPPGTQPITIDELRDGGLLAR